MTVTCTRNKIISCMRVRERQRIRQKIFMLLVNQPLIIKRLISKSSYRKIKINTIDSIHLHQFVDL